jgi:magnesium-transporting ATPase (P-type)
MKKSTTIPTRSIWSSLVALATIGFTYIQMIGYIIPGFETISKLTKETTTIKEIGLIWVPVITYLLISFSILMVVRIFKKLKPYKEKGLIWCLVLGLLLGLGLFMVGLIEGGLIGGCLIGGCLVMSLIWGFIGGFTVGLIRKLK